MRKPILGYSVRPYPPHLSLSSSPTTPATTKPTIKQSSNMNLKNQQALLGSSWTKHTRTTLLLWTLLLSITAVLSHTIDIASGQISCFFEDLHVDDKMTITFQVAGGGHLDIDFWLNDPQGNHLWNVIKRDTGTFTFTATQGANTTSALEAVKEEQQYIVVREKLHRNTAESTNDRVKWWSLVQTAMVLGVTAWQVFYLKRFFEVKRTI
ncbi:hypothetical protein PSTT_01106, partial [Puccinia striiformis]